MLATLATCQWQLRHFQLQLLAIHVHRIAPDLDLRAVGPGAIGEAKPPVMPGAGDDAVLDEAAGKRSPHVRAQVVHGEELAIYPEHGHFFLIHNDDGAAALGYVARLADNDSLTHAMLLTD